MIAVQLWRWKRLILLCMTSAGFAALVMNFIATPIYYASTTLMVQQALSTTQVDYQGLLGSQQIARNYSGLMAQRTIQEQVAAKLGVPFDQFDDIIVVISI
jgi:uncharacterized protein involved in exopolysaccharide biosynthesis